MQKLIFVFLMVLGFIANSVNAQETWTCLKSADGVVLAIREEKPGTLVIRTDSDLDERFVKSLKFPVLITNNEDFEVEAFADVSSFFFDRMVFQLEPAVNEFSGFRAYSFNIVDSDGRRTRWQIEYTPNTPG